MIDNMRSQSLADRQYQRYHALLDAGIEMLGDPKAPSVTVRAVCRTAGLTERYFYESFTDRDTFIRAVYGHVGELARAAIAGAVPATSPEAPVRAFVELVLDQPSVGRVLLLAPMSESAISGSGLALAPTFVSLVEAQLTGLSEDDRHLVAVGVVGALTALFVGYLDGTVRTPREKFVAHCVRLVSSASALVP
jgi:AcrR family transcriptional regulator